MRESGCNATELRRKRSEAQQVSFHPCHHPCNDKEPVPHVNLQHTLQQQVIMSAQTLQLREISLSGQQPFRRFTRQRQTLVPALPTQNVLQFRPMFVGIQLIDTTGKWSGHYARPQPQGEDMNGSTPGYTALKAVKSVAHRDRLHRPLPQLRAFAMMPRPGRLALAHE